MSENAKSVFDELISEIPNSLDKREGAVIHTILAPVAKKLADTENANTAAYENAYVDTAELEFLIRKAKERRIEYLDHTKAVIEAEIHLADDDMLEGGESFFTADSGVRYIVTTLSDDGKVYQLECEEFGTIGNIESGKLVFDGRGVTVISAEIIGVFSYGREAETADSLRNRYYDSFDALAFGGNKADYKEKCLSVSGIGGVQVRRAWNGGGTVKLVLVSSDYSSVSDDVVSDVQNLFDPIIDGVHTGEGIYSIIGHEVTACSAEETKINVISTIELEEGLAFSDIVDDIKEALKEYFSMSCHSWADNGKAVVRIGRIESVLTSVSGVVDAYDTTLNGTPSNIIFDGDNIPVIGTVNGI